MKIRLTLLALFYTVFVFGQNNDKIFDSYKTISDSDSQKIWFAFENQNFLHNNEYFNNLYEGITFIGYNFNPKFIYQPTRNLRLEAGWFFLKYAGRDEFSRSVPWFRCQYQISKKISFILGNIHGTLQHKLAEPLYSFDRHFYGNPETGLQFLINTKYFESDIWLNWEKFILPGDNFKEEFTMAGTGRFKFYNTEDKFQFSIPLQGLAAHKGGQTESSTAPLQTYFNSVIGLKADFHVFSNFENFIGTEDYFLGYSDASAEKVNFYSQGYGYLSNVYGKFGKFNISLGYWYGEHFIAPRGEPLFQSVSQKYTIWWEPKKQLILNKFQFNHTISKGIDIAVRFQSYYDLLQENMDFSYSIFLIVNQQFFLKKLSFNH